MRRSIDDSPHGVQSALAAGMLPIGFVDLNDPRPRRAEVLRESGAVLVAEGGAALLQCVIEADGMVGARPKALESVLHRY